VGFVFEPGPCLPGSERRAQGDRNATKLLSCSDWIIPKRISISRLLMKKVTGYARHLQEIIISLHQAPEDPDERNTKGIICAELGNLVCTRDEWAHVVQVASNYAPARANLAILSGPRMPLVASTSSAVAGDGFAFAR
jgi:hypothetical protein